MRLMPAVEAPAPPAISGAIRCSCFFPQPTQAQ
jgi:hypothetical protein